LELLCDSLFKENSINTGFMTANKILARVLVGGFAVFYALASSALTIGMPGMSWLDQYTVGLCSAKYNSNNYLSWSQLRSAPRQSINIGNNEVICIIGPGRAGSIGGVDAARIAYMLQQKVSHRKDLNNPILLLACASAVKPLHGHTALSVLDAMLTLEAHWQNTPIIGSLGTCITNRYASWPLFQTVLKKHLATSGVCSTSHLKILSNNLQANIQTDINACQQHKASILDIGDCLYKLSNQHGLNIQKSFYAPLLKYLIDHQCDQPLGVLQRSR